MLRHGEAGGDVGEAVGELFPVLGVAELGQPGAAQPSARVLRHSLYWHDIYRTSSKLIY